MLSLFRSFLNTWAARAFFIVLVASFALWGVADMLRNVGQDKALATVGDRKIDAPQFQEAFRRNLANFARMSGSTAEPAPEIRRAIAGETLEQLIVQAAIGDEVQRLGLDVPDNAVRAAVFALPAFKGPSGAFDKATFDNVLRNNGLTEVRFLDLVRTELGQRQLLESADAGVATPETLLKQAYAFQRETRSGEVVQLAFNAAAAPPAPSGDDLQRQYENDPAAYTAPAYRRIKLVVLSPATLAGGIDVSPEDIKAYYDAHRSDYVTEATRSAQIVIAPDAAAANTIATQWSAGTDWTAIQKAAQDAGGSAVALEDSTRQQFPTTELADAVFAAALNVVSPPTKAPFGYQVVRVTKITPGQSRTLEQETDSIRKKVAEERAIDLVDARANKLDDALSAGTPLDDLSGDVGAVGVSGTLDAQGNTQEGEPAPIPGSPALRTAIVAAAFAAQRGDKPHMIEGPNHAYYALEVEDIIDPKLKPFDEVEARVRENWLAAQRRHEQDVAAAKLLTAVQAGGSLEDAATLAGLSMRQTPPITRDGQNPAVPPLVQQSLFRLKQGAATMVEAPDAFWIVKLTTVTDPDLAQDPAGAGQFREALTRALDQDVQATFAAALRDRAQPKVNRAMLDSLIQ